MIEFLYTKTPLAFFVQDFWRDEAFSYVLAKKNIFEIIYLSLQDFSPPLYHFVLKIWMIIFGSSEVALRSLSLFCFVLLLFTAFHTFLDVFKYNHKKSFLGMLLFLINPILLYYAFEARSYSMFAFLSTLSFYAFITRKKNLYLFATIAGLYTHYFMIFAVLAQIAYSVIHKSAIFKERLKWSYFAFATFLPWLFLAVIQKATTSSSFWIDKVKFRDILYMPSVLYTGYEKNFHFPDLNKYSYPYFLLIISVIFVFSVVVAYIKLHKRKDQEKMHLFILFALWTLVPAILVFGLSFFKSLYLPRYLILCAPAIIFLFVYSLKFIRRPLNYILLGAVVVMTLHYNNLQIEYRRKSSVKKVFNEIKAFADANDVIYVPNELDFFTAQYYIDDKRIYVYGKTHDQIPGFVGKALIPQDRVRSELPSYPSRAFIFRGRQYEIQSLY